MSRQAPAAIGADVRLSYLPCITSLSAVLSPGPFQDLYADLNDDQPVATGEPDSEVCTHLLFLSVRLCLDCAGEEISTYLEGGWMPCRLICGIVVLAARRRFAQDD